MNQIVTVFLITLGAIFLAGLGSFGVISYREGQRRATRVAFASGLLGFILFTTLAVAPKPVPTLAAWIVIVLVMVSLVLLALPKGRWEPGKEAPHQRFDERETMFARMRLQPGSPAYQVYYRLHPDQEIADNLTRAKPGLLNPQARFANPFQFAAVEGSFFTTESLREAVDGPVSSEKHSLPPKEMTAYLKALTRYYGAAEVGITALAPYHLYSHVGRGTGTYGEAIPVEHRVAIAFTVVMDHAMVGTAPYPPTSLETGKQYVEAARIAIQLAAAIRSLGYPARAHIDGNYRVIAPLVARDAGLGEIGRMTILMTPRHGARVRLGVVTTDLELLLDRRLPDQSILDFCNFCEKCARTCPGRSIPFGPPQEIQGVLRWVLDADTCFRYWNAVGTDCARCMAVCPFSHSETILHNIVRWGVRRSGCFRRAALWLDDLFYGRKPAPRRPPKWVDVA